MRRYLVPLYAAALAGALLPVAPARADGKPAFSGYRASAWAAPVRIEIYEPTIPIPAEPQLEVELAYSTVEADSGSSQARASWLWPGDPLGEGMKTFVEQLGLPEQLGENGYPVQVNAAQPSGNAAQADEPFPGTVMRTSATAEKTTAHVGFSPDGDVGDGSEDGGGESGDEGTPGVPALPGIPELPGIPGSVPALDLKAFGQAITGTGDDPEPAAAPGLPPELAALVDVEGYTSSSRTTATPTGVVSTARSALGDVSLLGGLLRLDGLVVTSSSSSDGTTGAPTGRARLGGLTIAGQEFSVGPDGFEAAGRQGAIPGLPDQAAQALAALGVRLELPAPHLEHDHDLATSDLAGLRIEVDTVALLGKLKTLPLDDVIGAIPEQAGQLASLLQTASGLSPRVVVTLGNAGSEVDTVQGVPMPDVPAGAPVAPTADPSETATPADDPAKDGGPGGGGTPTGGDSSPGGGAPAGSKAPAAAAGDLGGAQLTGSGLPALYTIPGAILVGGLALGALGGTWLRRAGVLALGGAGSCSHGLDTGLPDLRKAR